MEAQEKQTRSDILVTVDTHAHTHTHSHTHAHTHTHTHTQAAEESAKLVVSMKTILYGTDSQEPQSDLAAQLAQEFYSHDMLLLLVDNLHKLDFEVSVDVLYNHKYKGNRTL